jgi:hypothetical protein
MIVGKRFAKETIGLSNALAIAHDGNDVGAPGKQISRRRQYNMPPTPYDHSMRLYFRHA